MKREKTPADIAVFALADLMLYHDHFWKKWREPKYCIAYVKRLLAEQCHEYYHTVGSHWMTPCTKDEYLLEQEEFVDFWEARADFEERMR